MTTETVPFQFRGQEIRSVPIDGEPWFVATDVAQILGYRDSNSLTRRIDPEDKGTQILRTLGGDQALTVINEAGLYTGVLGSTVPDAREFKLWVVRVVLPAIRMTGSYSVAPVEAPAELSRLEILTLALDSERRAITAEAQAAELTPRAEAWDTLASADGDYDVAEAAKILVRAGVKTGPQRLFNELARLRWTFRSAGKWEPYASAVDAGYLTTRPQSHHHPRTGVVVLDPPQVRVTLKGIERLRIRLTELKAVAA
jgi:prophage antirepressor-like protein